MHEKPRSTSQLIKEVIDECNGRVLTVRAFIEMMGERTFAVSALIFGIISAIVPGVSIVAAIPILLIGFQLVMGRDYIWLPKKIANAQFKDEFFAKGLRKALPVLKKLEKLFRPRFSFVFTQTGERIIGLFLMVLSLILLLPLPGVNFLPGILVIAIALSILERDGLMASIAMIASAVVIFLMIDVVAIAISKLSVEIVKLFT